MPVFQPKALHCDKYRNLTQPNVMINYQLFFTFRPAKGSLSLFVK